jgi:tetratricopeptide (TPR) repeat protein
MLVVPCLHVGIEMNRRAEDMNFFRAVSACFLLVSALLGLWLGGHFYFVTLLLFVVVGGYLLIAIHEMGHVVGAWVGGLQPMEMRIGTGLELVAFHWLGMRASFGSNFFSGFVTADWKGDYSRRRLRDLVYILGGPFATLLAFLAGMGIFLAHGGPDGDPIAGVTPLSFAAIFAGQNLSLFLGLFGPDAAIDGVSSKRDLNAAVAVLFGEKKTAEDNEKIQRQYDDLIKRGEWNEAWKHVENAWMASPRYAGNFELFVVYVGMAAVPKLERTVSSILANLKPTRSELISLLFTRGACHAFRGNHDKARLCFSEGFDTALELGEKADFCERVTCLVIIARLSGVIPVADDYSRRALELLPEKTTLKGTRGAILIEMGRIEEGRALLEEVFSRTESEDDKMICAFYLALANRKLGNVSCVQEWREQMMQHSHPKWLLDRCVELEVESEGGAEPLRPGAKLRGREERS